MRRMFVDCRLVHGDLSEYNLLYFQNELYIIDVSQSVEHDHPQALDFLRKDSMNVNDFFERRGVRVGGTRRTFDFIVKEGGTEEGWLEDECEKMREEVRKADESEEAEGEEGGKGREGGLEEAVFMGSYIPRSLHELPNSFEEARRLEAGEREGVYTAAVRQMLVPVKEGKEEGKANAKEKKELKPIDGEKKEEVEESKNGVEESKNGVEEEVEGEEEEDADEDEEGEEDVDCDDDDDDDQDDEEWREKKKGGMGGRGLTEEERAARKADRKADKKAVKAERSEKRKSKIPKHIKKAKIKATSGARKKR